ncbi:kinase-like domain-containing protein [Cokeromyces recurvatus]|uniref:kinase-like domain-containing protein n=1 Tax=Cokeromyces recurvatus TaxID=90255 RepID=UPI00221F6130|nr:kinase-like domain-containing protein [Cokeromyces recurvatus]KAI7903154.1 kinase-like domain-containing protein [Cokeromyces recurvatus]
MKSDNKQQQVVWSSENVTNWLISNGWSSLVNAFNEKFKLEYNIQHDRFLNLNMETLNDLLKNTDISTLDKQQLVTAIQKLKRQSQVQRLKPRIAIPSFFKRTPNRNSKSSITSTSTYSSTNSLLLPTTTATNYTTNFDITQHIPKRTSSTETNISKLLENFNPSSTTLYLSSKRPKSSRINVTDPEVLSKLFGKRLPISQQPQDHRIQVTLDADTFIRLWIKHPSNALDIKHAVLFKLNIDADPNYFLFYHENGPQANDNHTNRILVVPIEGYTLVQQYQNNSYMTRYILIQNSPVPSPISSSSITGIQLMDPHEEYNEELSPIPSSNFWTTTPSTLDQAKASTASPSSSWYVHTSNVSSSPVSTLWPVGELRTEKSGDSPGMERIIEGISLYDPPTPIQDQPTSQLPNNTTIHVESPPSPNDTEKRALKLDKSKNDQPLLSSSSFDLVSKQTSEDDIFGERPSVEKLYQNIDKYLPGHDLDKEILIETINNNNNNTIAITDIIVPTASKRLLGHQPSVRVVAKEAHQRWKQAANNVMIVNNFMLRRKSTKMWDRPVERVKPGEENRIILPNGITPTKMQWMKGNLIGRGSFGRVYHALNIATGEWLAVKEVDVVVTQADKRNADLQAASDALYREISLLKDLDHMNIVQYMGYDCNTDEGQIYIFLEYVPGGSISSLLNQYKFFDEPLIKFFTRQILQGLQYLHERHIIHRDIKGGNVLIDQNGICKITDFGLSKNQQESGVYDPHSNHSQMKGTLYWMAPEVLTNNYSAKVDVWSLGCTVLEMITGQHPWTELTTLAALYQIGLHNAPDIPDYISNEAKEFLQLCLKIKPEDRPTASELLQHPFVQVDPNFNFKESLKQQQPKLI